MKIYLSFLIIFLSFSHFFAQNEIENNESITKKLPSVKLKDYKGKIVNITYIFEHTHSYK